MRGLPKSRLCSPIGAVLLIASAAAPPAAYAQQSAGDKLVKEADPDAVALMLAAAVAGNQECVDPSVAAQPENLNKPICIGPPAAPAGSPNWFRYGSFPMTEGRVGYHMTSHNAFYDNDVPPECGHNAQNSYMLEAAVEGDLPPGLSYSPHEAQFEGTPRQPGDWDVTVVYSHMRCRGSELDFGNRRIPVHFHINP